MSNMDFSTIFTDEFNKISSIEDACKLYHSIREALDEALSIFDNGYTCDAYYKGVSDGSPRGTK